MRSALIFACAALAGTITALVFSPLWLLGTLAAGLVVAAITNRESAPSPAGGTQKSMSAFDSLRHDAILRLSSTLEVVEASPSATKVLGRPAGDLAGTALADLVSAEDFARLDQGIESMAEVDRALVSMSLAFRSTGSWRDVEVTATADPAATDSAGFVMLVSDNSVQERLRDRLLSTQRELEAVAELSEMALRGSEEQTLLRTGAAAVHRALDAESIEVWSVAGTDAALLSGVGPGGAPTHRDSGTAENRTRAIQAGELDETVLESDREPGGSSFLSVPIRGRTQVQGALIARSKTGVSFAATEAALLESIAGVLALARRQRGAEQDAFRRSRHDELTGLVNRDVFLERLQTWVERSADNGEMIGVLLIDLDHFKIINDGLGHTAGDALLEAVSNRLATGLRPGDTLARFGGDEFVVLTRGISNAQQAALSARRMLSVLGEPFRIVGHDVQVTASVGVTFCDDPAMSTETLLQQADAALYKAKDQGRERVELFRSEMLEEAVTRLRTEEELRHALANDQLRVFYQPIVDLATGKTEAVEALVRWVHPGRGLVAPSEFIPISEATGLIEEIGAWVIDEACRQAKTWVEQGNPTRVSINLSARQLADATLMNTIDAALVEHDLDSALFSVEFTENVLSSNPAPKMEALEALNERGIGVAIDDFGIGNSSLSSLKVLPVDAVKIDRSLISGIGRSGDDYAVVATMIKLAQTLRKRVVAEGVETEEQLELLRDLGCDMAQGFLFSPAVFDLDHGSTDTGWSALVLEARH